MEKARLQIKTELHSLYKIALKFGRIEKFAKLTAVTI